MQFLERKTMKTMIQQGDCLIKRCGVKNVFIVEHDSIPGDANLIAGNVLHFGDNHQHAFESGKFQILEKDQIRFVRVIEPSILSHGEHGSHTIEPGEYFLDIINEFDHPDEESRKVID
jgi:hypothetical protein